MNKLNYFTEEDGKAKGEINMTGATVIVKREPGKAHYMEIHTAGASSAAGEIDEILEGEELEASAPPVASKVRPVEPMM